MRTSKGKKYCINESRLNQYRLALKLVFCPHCHQIGFLIGHGFLVGYAERGEELVIRGRRFFCSNRFRRQGCGRTFSVLISDVLLGFVVRASTLFAFLNGVALGLSRRASWLKVSDGKFSIQSGYRLWRKLQGSQAHIRTILNRERPPPDCVAAEPLIQMLDHLRSIFPSSACPFTSFQTHFQVSLFG
jgi:hypothetical protein